MDASGLMVQKSDDDQKGLKVLLDAFGSVFSLEEIASAYCKARRNADDAGYILSDMKGSPVASTTDNTHCVAKSELSEEFSCGNISEKLVQGDGNPGSSKEKWRPISVGTVSSVIDKDYVRSTSLANGSCMAAKPLKLDSKVLPASELSGKDSKLDACKDDQMHRDMEDFLFKMLGEGFQLDRDVIREVLGKCGYNMEKSMDRLFDLSAAVSKRGNNFLGKSKKEVLQSQKEMRSADNSESVPGTYGGKLNRERRQRSNLEEEILASLFNNSGRQTESSSPVKAVKRSKAYGQVVATPLPDSFLLDKKDIVDFQQDSNADVEDLDEEDSYEVLRRAVEEYRATMREYYKAAVEAFAKGDHARAGKLLEKGRFFCKKAREADEESYQKIFETRNKNTADFMLLDLHDHGAKEAIRLLKRHLLSLAGIPTFNYLKVIIETNEEDVSKGARKRLPETELRGLPFTFVFIELRELEFQMKILRMVLKLIHVKPFDQVKEGHSSFAIFYVDDLQLLWSPIWITFYFLVKNLLCR
ncbi:putative nuclear RNA export factor SDE5 isoform X1 [Syzygium oleosum]|uniref:putative nuclear RNA export factor SDE5 isoform X1 n=1 Tax=Syzygium oleosum TaxID=219896 RepID=UPI0024BB0504|nr:putative nuclear RNA export factor SDE5 isoform X1 [Syzygium oleosum]XP_056172056.1 putative nuclear RNA export factor SDE5 isoform X1 [Syzygium oleosum]